MTSALWLRRVNLGDGSLGLTVDADMVVAKIAPGGAALLGGVALGWRLIAVNATPLSGLPHVEALGVIRSASRPLLAEFQVPVAVPAHVGQGDVVAVGVPPVAAVPGVRAPHLFVHSSHVVILWHSRCPPRLVVMVGVGVVAAVPLCCH